MDLAARTDPQVQQRTPEYVDNLSVSHNLFYPSVKFRLLYLTINNNLTHNVLSPVASLSLNGFALKFDQSHIMVERVTSIAILLGDIVCR